MVVFFAVFTMPVFLTAAGDSTSFTENPACTAIIHQLRAGGFVLYMRHGSTDTTCVDRAPRVDLNDCSTQRPLTEEGRKEAAMVGRAIRKAEIPIGEVFASPMCRTRQTAEAAFGSDYVVDQNLMYTAYLTSMEKIPRAAATRRLLSAPVPPGRNRVVVAHAPNLMDTMGYYPKTEGIVVVFKPLGDRKFEYIASIPPRWWSKLEE